MNGIIIMLIYWNLELSLQHEREKQDFQMRVDECKRRHKEQMNDLKMELSKLNTTKKLIEHESNSTKSTLEQERNEFQFCNKDKRVLWAKMKAQQEEVMRLKMELTHNTTQNENCQQKDEALIQEILALKMKLVTLETNMSICVNANKTCQARLEKSEITLQEHMRKYTVCLEDSDNRYHEKSQKYAHCTIELESCKLHLIKYKELHENCENKKWLF